MNFRIAIHVVLGCAGSIAWAATARGQEVAPPPAFSLAAAHTPGPTAGDPDFALLVNAPSAVLASSFADPSRLSVTAASAKAREQHEDKLHSEAERNSACESGQLHGKPCRVSWPRVLGSSLIFLAAQHGGNIWMDADVRKFLTMPDFWGKYFQCVRNYRWSRWKDDDPFAIDYLGHPMMGSLTSFIYEQNDPKQRALTFENSQRYWMGRLRAMAYSAAYSAQWKIGPASEASIGNSGYGYYLRLRDGIVTNETGMQDFFITPVGGFAWNVGEDLIDRYLFLRIQHAHPRNRPLLFVASFMTPTRGAANLARFRAPYYNDQDLRTLDYTVR